MTTLTPVQVGNQAMKPVPSIFSRFSRYRTYLAGHLADVFASFVIMMLAAVFGYRIAITRLPALRDFPIMNREHMMHEGAVFSPVTAFIRMEKQNETNHPVTDIVIDEHDYVRSLPDNLKTLRYLNTLVIQNQPMQELPDSIGSLTNLTTLIIANTPISALPDSIGALTNLERLEIRGTHIKKLPDSIGALTNLETLQLSYNRLDSLPESVTNLTKLTMLDLAGNNFYTIPSYLPPKLRYIFLGANHIPRDDVTTLDESHVIIGVYH